MVFQCSIKMNPCYLMTLNLVFFIYEEKLSAKVQLKSTHAPTQFIDVLCLEKPFEINTLIHSKASKKSSFDVEKVYRTEISKHKLTKMEKKHESGYENTEIALVGIGVSTPLFLAKPPLNQQTVQALFRQSPFIYWFFVTKSQKILKFFYP